MLVLEILLVLVILVAAIAVALGWGDRMVDVPVDRVAAGLPPGTSVSAYDVPRTRFNLALRGYRMDEVDSVLGRLAAALADRDAHIEELESHLAIAGRPSSMTTLPAPGPDFPTPGPGTSPDPVPPSQPGELPQLPQPVGDPVPDVLPAPGELPR